MPPVFISDVYENPLVLSQEDELILNCSVYSQPISQIVWLKDGLRLSSKKETNLSFLNNNQTLVDI